MEMIDMMYELANSKAALEASNRMIRRLNAKCMRKNLAIAGLVWFGVSVCKMLGESDKKRKEAESRARDAEAEMAKMQTERWEKDDCCNCAGIREKI